MSESPGRQLRRGLTSSSRPACWPGGRTEKPGQRTRDEYVLTPAGMDFMPVVWALFQWGQRHLPDPVPLRLAHAGCDAGVEVGMRCSRGIW